MDAVADDSRRVNSPPLERARTPDTPRVEVSAIRSLWPSNERLLLMLLLVAVAHVRLVSPGLLEPNVSTAEVSHLATLESMAAGRSPGLLGRTSVGASPLALLPVTVLRQVRPEADLALRFYAAIGSIAFVGLFYLLCRSQLTPVVSLAATALLAFAPASIFFGRNGELNAFVGLWATAAALLLSRAMQHGGLRAWLLVGAASTAGLYWHPSAAWVLPALLLPPIWTAIERPERRRRMTAGLVVLVVGALLVAAPRVSGLLSEPVATSTMLAAEGAQADPPTSLRTRAQQTVRAFVLLDPRVAGDTRYQLPGQAPLDALTGLLFLAGVVLATWRRPAQVLPLALLVVPLVGGQLASARVPTLADAVVATPGVYLLVAHAIDRMLAVLPFPSIVRAVVLVAVPAYALFGWNAYTGWIGSAAQAQARQPALDYDEVEAWIGEQRARLANGQPIASARDWRNEHQRLSSGSRTVRRSRDAAPASPQTFPSRLDLRQVGAVTGDSGPRGPRSVAANSAGEVFVADMSGRLSKVDADRGVLTPLQQRAPAFEQVSDLATDSEGFLYLADAERSLLYKLKSTGELVATLGAEWGMYRPRGIGIGPDGRIYVADTGRNRIAVGTPDGRFQKAITPPASFGPFEQPTEVAIDASGRVYVGLPEISRIAILEESGEILGGWSIPKGNTFESSRFEVIADGIIAITDPAEGKLRLLDADGRELSATDAPGRPYGVALAMSQLFVASPGTGRLIVFSLGAP
jgi:DNA-binding beta-propeller fold protein YncE/4-amino-4-deoxy-L-arabinose transferase-like glycosyltransferase